MIFLEISIYYLLKNVHFNKICQINLEKLAKKHNFGTLVSLMIFASFKANSIHTIHST